MAFLKYNKNLISALFQSFILRKKMPYINNTQSLWKTNLNLDISGWFKRQILIVQKEKKTTINGDSPFQHTTLFTLQEDHDYMRSFSFGFC